MNNVNRRKLVWDLMTDGEWHSTMEINDVKVGGSEGCRRLREIRAEVFNGLRYPWFGVARRKKKGDTTQYEYRLLRRYPRPKGSRL